MSALERDQTDNLNLKLFQGVADRDGGYGQVFDPEKLTEVMAEGLGIALGPLGSLMSEVTDCLEESVVSPDNRPIEAAVYRQTKVDEETSWIEAKVVQIAGMHAQTSVVEKAEGHGQGS